MIRRLALTLLCTLVPEAGAAQGARVDPAAIDAIFKFADAKSPGCAVSTTRNGELEFARGYGMADLEHNVPIVPQSAFYMASVSKQFTAAAINLLVADGKLSLDDDVRKWVPELPQYEAPITVRHLVHHTSGLRDYLSLFFITGLGDFDINNRDFLEMMARQRALNFKPGTQYSYTNSGYVMLSIIVERVSGKSLRAFAEERMFRPLGMSNTVFRDRNAMLIRNRALAYFKEADTWLHAVPHFDVVGDGGMFSTVEDLVRWERHMLDPQAQQFGGAKWRELTDARGQLVDGTALTYGAGLTHGTFEGEGTVEHGGGFGGYSTYLLRLPRARLSVAVLCNGGSNAGQLARNVASLYLPRAAPVARAASAPVTAISAPERASFTGMFFSKQSNLLRDIAVDDGKLFYVRGPGNRSELAPLGGSRFQMVGTELTLRFSGRDTMTIEPYPGDPGSRFIRVTAGRRELRDYAGAYVSSDLPARWTVQVADSALTLTRARGTPFRVERAFDDAFRGQVFVQFVRDAQGAIAAMEVSSGERARRIRFDRQR